MLLSKLAPQSLRSLSGALKMEMYPCHRNLATVFAVWSRVTYAITCLMKWSQKPKTFTMCGSWSSSIVISMLVKSTWSSSKGEVTRTVYRGAFTLVPACWIHLSQLQIAFCICNSHVRPPETGLAIGTTFAVGLNVLCPYGTHSWLPFHEPWGLQTAQLLPALQPEYGSGKGHPWWSVNFFLSLRMAMPSSVMVWSPRRCLRFCTLWEEIHSMTILSMGSSCCTAIQSVTCKFTCVWVACAWTAVSFTCWCIPLSASATIESWASALPVVPTVTPSRIDFTVSAFSLDVIWLRASATALSLPFLIFNAKCESC